MRLLRFHFRDEGGSVSHCRFFVSVDGGDLDGASAAGAALQLGALIDNLTDAALIKIEIIDEVMIPGLPEPAIGSDNSVSCCLMYLDSGGHYHQVLIPSPQEYCFVETGAWAGISVDGDQRDIQNWNALIIGSMVRSVDGNQLASFYAGLKEIR